MEWRDEGVLLGVRKHGESSVIADVLTSAHGRHLGVIRGGASRKQAQILQPGAQLDVTWRARLNDHMGSFTIELIKSRMGDVFSDRRALAGLNAVVALCRFALPERDPCPGFFTKTAGCLDLLHDFEVWPLAYLFWEMSLLEEVGFALDLSCCAVTGEQEPLAYVSPKTGRAVSERGAGEWADRLLPLPVVMLGKGSAELTDILKGLTTTGYFLNRRVAPALGNQELPSARDTLIRRLRQ